MPAANDASTADPVAAVRAAIESVRPQVTMWRDGLTVIPLESGLPNQQPFDQAEAGGAT